MNINRITAALAGILLCLGLTAPAAQAAPIVPDPGYESFASTYDPATNPSPTPWWNAATGFRDAFGLTSYQYVWPNFPVECYQDDTTHGGTAASAFKALWVYPDTAVSKRDDAVANIRKQIRGADSLFAASAKRFLYNKSDLFNHSLSPRWVTSTACDVQVSAVAVPLAVYDSSPWATDPGSIRDYLVAHGYNEPNRKYVVWLQRNPTGATGQSYSENLSGSTGDTRPSLDNNGNYNSFTFMLDVNVTSPYEDNADWTQEGQELGHEMAHSLGALTGAAPHNNPDPQMSGHPTDCNDILCYGGTGVNETIVCGTSPNREGLYGSRMDCNRDDYFTAAGDNVNGSPGVTEKAWSATWWDIAHSSFLYGNPQPTQAQLDAHPTAASS